MDNYVIGIIDDEERAVNKIKVTIKENRPQNIEVSFKEYILNEQENIKIENLTKQILEDIQNNEIVTLIIDEKIIRNDTEVKGSKLFDEIKQKVEKFPMIILTNWDEDVEATYLIDPDKIYRKIDFFDLAKEKSKEQVKNIFINAKMYKDNREKLERKIQNLEEKISEQGTTEQVETISEISEHEEKLKQLKPTDYNQIEKYMKPDEIKEVLDILKEANDLLE